MDPYTGYQLPLLPPGENAVVKLGNDLGGGQGECIDYDFVVDPDNPILTIKYAFVLKNGNLSSTSPTFSIFFLNPQNTGTSYSPYIYPCGLLFRYPAHPKLCDFSNDRNSALEAMVKYHH